MAQPSRSRAVPAVFTGLLCAIVACAQGPSPQNGQGAAVSTLDSLRTAIVEATEPADASSPAACRLAALGAKPCGGPRGFIAYSVEATDSVQLADLLATYLREDERLNREMGLVSDCMVVGRPSVGVRDGRCVIVR